MRCEVVFGFVEVAVLLDILECHLCLVDQQIKVDDLRRVTKRVTRWDEVGYEVGYDVCYEVGYEVGTRGVKRGM